MVGFTSFATLATVVVWLPSARGETATPWFSATRLRSAVAVGAILVWLPAARGESRASPALTLRVIAVRAAAPIAVRSIRIFILIFFLILAGASLHRRM